MADPSGYVVTDPSLIRCNSEDGGDIASESRSSTFDESSIHDEDISETFILPTNQPTDNSFRCPKQGDHGAGEVDRNESKKCGDLAEKVLLDGDPCLDSSNACSNLRFDKNSQLNIARESSCHAVSAAKDQAVGTCDRDVIMHESEKDHVDIKKCDELSQNIATPMNGNSVRNPSAAHTYDRPQKVEKVPNWSQSENPNVEKVTQNESMINASIRLSGVIPLKPELKQPEDASNYRICTPSDPEALHAAEYKQLMKTDPNVSLAAQNNRTDTIRYSGLPLTTEKKANEETVPEESAPRVIHAEVVDPTKAAEAEAEKARLEKLNHLYKKGFLCTLAALIVVAVVVVVVVVFSGRGDPDEEEIPSNFVRTASPQITKEISTTPPRTEKAKSTMPINDEATLYPITVQPATRRPTPSPKEAFQDRISLLVAVDQYVSDVLNENDHIFTSQYGNHINDWNVSMVEDFSELFSGWRNPNMHEFQEYIGDWDVSRGTTFRSMFRNATMFKGGGVEKWNVSQAIDMDGMFWAAMAFDADLGSWDVSKVTNMNGMFAEAQSFAGDGLDNWIVDEVQDIAYMFQDDLKFNANLEGWQITNVESLVMTFYRAMSFTGSGLANWHVGRVTDMTMTFYQAYSFNANLMNWDLSRVTSCFGMFDQAQSFSGEGLDDWNVKSVGDMSFMFSQAEKFNADLMNWDTSSVTSLDAMFQAAVSFTGSGLDSWNVDEVDDMSYTFFNAKAFDADLTNWKTTKVTTMEAMFYGAESFQGSGLDSWDVENVQTFDHMLCDADSFDQDQVAGWNASLAKMLVC